MKRFFLIPLTFILCGAFSLGYAYVVLNQPLSVQLENPEIEPSFEVTKGASLNYVLSSLVQQDVVSMPLWLFKIYARLTNEQGTIKAGEYSLAGELTPITLLSMFREGRVVLHTVQFPEGWTFATWRENFKSQPALKQELAGYTDYSLMRLLGFEGVSPEGQFFPDTYSYQKGDSDISVLRQAHLRMKEVLVNEWDQRTEHNLFDSVDEALILASIIEKETAYEPDRIRVASVFVNRLKKKMKLQTDPTVIYGIENFDGNLRRKHLRSPTPYNTYVIAGLPPTPICNPGLNSIRAALQPEISNYYYFVARGDGSSEFSETLAEHNRAVVRYQKSGRVEGYRSSPL
jgi:UPF0755 protein